jgi:hypothetical protein
MFYLLITYGLTVLGIDNTNVNIMVIITHLIHYLKMNYLIFSVY